MYVSAFCEREKGMRNRHNTFCHPNALHFDDILSLLFLEKQDWKSLVQDCENRENLLAMNKHVWTHDRIWKSFEKLILSFHFTF